MKNDKGSGAFKAPDPLLFKHLNAINMSSFIKIQKTLSTSELQQLQIKWLNLAKSISMPSSIAKSYFEKIVDYYSEKHRAYHNLSHIKSMLTLLDSGFQPYHKNILQLVIWFHDIIYNPLKKNNEAKSAALCQEMLHDYIPSKALKMIEQLILSTQKHQPLLEGFDNKLLLDLDLAVLGTDESTYKQYAKAIRKEYWLYPTFLYNRGRKKVLLHFLERERLYFTSFFYKKFEARARVNLVNEIG